MFQVRLKGASISFKGISRVLKKVYKVCQGSFNGAKSVFKKVSKKFQGCFKNVSRKFKGISRVWRLKGVSREILVGYKGI